MTLTRELLLALDVALNHARLLSLTVDPVRRVATAELAVRTLPEAGPPPADARVLLDLYPVGQVAAVLKQGRWNDPCAPLEPLTLDQLDAAVYSFGGRPLTGWQFFDVPAKRFAHWAARLSFCRALGAGGLAHMLTLFQEDGDQRALDICLWFDEISVRDLRGTTVQLDEFINGGLRWWAAFYKGDPRTRHDDSDLLNRAA